MKKVIWSIPLEGRLNFFKELAKSNHRSSKPELCGRLQDSLNRDTIPELLSISSTNEVGGKNDYTGGNRGDAKKENNSISAKRTRAICKLNFHSPEEIFRILTSNKFEETKLLCQMQPFQNGRFISLERVPRGGKLSLLFGSKRRVFFSASSPRLSKACKISTETKVVPISLPLFRIDFSTQGVYKNHESSNCYTKKIKCSVDSLLKRYFAKCQV